MAEIKIKINALNDSITELKNLKTACQDWDTTCPETVGGGQTVNELESMGTLYKNLNTHFINLVSNTISFMENVKTSYEESDNKAARSISAAADAVETVIKGPIHTGNNHPPEGINVKTIIDIVKEEISNIPEDAQSAGEALSWIEKQYGKLPKWVTHGVDVFVPSSLKDAYILTSGILQGDLTLKEGWDVATNILKGNPKIAAICETINYTFETGMARSDEMEKQIYEQLSEGDVLGAVFDGAEGFIDTIIGGSVEVLGDVGGGVIDSAIDNIPVVKGINMLAEYGTGLLGWNEGEGYSVGGLVGEATEKVAEGIDIATDFITDTTDKVTDVITTGVKNGVGWVKSLFD